MIEVELEHSEKIIRLLQKATDDLEDAQPLMQELAETMRFAVGRNFEEQGRPSWLPLKSREGMILQDTKNLSESIDTLATRDTAQVGTNVEYAAIHHFGGEAGRKDANGKYTTVIPARPFLMLTSSDEEALEQGLKEYIEKMFKTP